MSGLRLIFSRNAKTQIKSIFRYTQQTWGEQQREKYMSKLFSAIDQLVKKPALGKSRDELSQGLLSHRVEKHVIFYRSSDHELRILAVLHTSMNPILHLNET